MLDFTPIRDNEVSIAEFAAEIDKDDLVRLTDEMIDHLLERISGCRDEQVVFVPRDEEAYDPVAATPEEVHMPWTLGHVIVHTTASAEESAFLAAEMARGVPYHGRSRWEVPWQTIHTVAQCRQRLEESRRMRLASLEMWPADPHLEVVYRPREGEAGFNAIARFLLGLMHEQDHLGQIEDILQQSSK